MALKQFKTLELKDRETTKLQENIGEFLDRLPKNLLDGVLLNKTLGSNPQDIVIGTTRTLVSHGLGRDYQGFIITDQTGNANVWRDSSYNESKDKFIPLIASSVVTVKIWVF